MQETLVRFLGWDICWRIDRLPTHSSILTWRIPWTVYPWGLQELDMTERLTFTFQQKNGIIKVPLCLLYINMRQKFEKVKQEKDGETCQKLPSIIQVNILAMN